MYQNPYINQYQPIPQFGMTAQQRMEQMQQQYPQLAQQQPIGQNVNWIYVTGAQGAKEHIVQPNQTIWMMDNNEMVFYVKRADGLGTTEFKAYKFEEITDTAGQPVPAPQIDLSQYVQRNEFEDLKAQIDKLSNVNKTTQNKANKEG